MTDLLLFNLDDELRAVLSNEGELACPFWDAIFEEVLNGGASFEFTAPADHEDARYIVADNQVAFLDKDGVFRLFLIDSVEKSYDGDMQIVRAVCSPAMLELNDEIIEDKRPYDKTAKVALTRALEDTRWKVGTVAELGVNSTNFYYITATEAINAIVETWGGEIRDRIEIQDNRITGRYIDILARRGSDTGKLWEIDKDIMTITHTVTGNPKTAMYGRGSSLETDDGGFSRKITFADVVWQKSKGDPVDKPKGQEWVGDPDALARFGRIGSDGKKRHRMGVYENGNQKEPAQLLRETWAELQMRNTLMDTYEMDVFLLEDISGYEHEKVRLGDTTIALDRTFADPIEVEARVVSFKYDVADPDNTGSVQLGQYTDLYEDVDRLDRIEQELNDKSGIWDGVERPISDGDITNVTPTKVLKVKATGAFKTIIVEWSYVGTISIQHYEVYASQVKGFTPDDSNLVFRGKTGVYSQPADVNQQWYFRVRAVNTHGTPGPFSEEAMAQTARIITDDILFGAVNAEILADLAVEASKLADQAVEEAKLGNKAVGASKIANLAVGNAAIQNLAVGSSKIDTLAVGTGQIENLAITNGKIANLAVDDAKISSLSVDKLKAGTLDASKVKIYGGSTTDYTRIEGSLFESRGTFRRTWRGKTSVHDTRSRFQSGYLRMRNDTETRSLYFSDFGISTFIDGEGELGGSSGSILWWDPTYSPSNANGLTINSYGGVVALTSDLNRVVIDPYLSASIESRTAPVFLRPYTKDRVGYNAYSFGIFDAESSSGTDGRLLYGSDVNGYGSGLRFSKDAADPRVSVINGDAERGGKATLDAGRVFANEIRKRDGTGGVYWNASSGGTTSGSTLDNTLFASGIRANPGSSDIFLATNTGAVRVTSSAGYNNGDGISYRPIAASDFVTISTETAKQNIEPFEVRALDIVEETSVYTYHLNGEIDDGIYDNRHVGFVSERASDILKQDGGAISQYRSVAINWKATQELAEAVKDLRQRVEDLELMMEVR